MNFQEQMLNTPAAAVDPRYATARDAATRSSFHRFGRPPTEDEFRQSIGHFLPAGVAAPVVEGNETATTADALLDQVASLDAPSNPVPIVVAPGADGELRCRFGKGRYVGWLRVSIQDTPSANFRMNTAPTRPAFLQKPPVVVECAGDVHTADRRSVRPLSARVTVDDRMAGRAAYQDLGAGIMEGPGQIVLRVVNKGPFDVEAAVGVRTA